MIFSYLAALVVYICYPYNANSISDGLVEAKSLDLLLIYNTIFIDYFLFIITS